MAKKKSSAELGPKVDPVRLAGEDDDSRAKERELRLRQSADFDPNKFTSSRLSEVARDKYGRALTPPEPVATQLDRVDDESVIPAEDDPSGKKEGHDGEDLLDLETDPKFKEFGLVDKIGC